VSASVAGWAVAGEAIAAASLWATSVTLWPFVPAWAWSRTVERKSVDIIIVRMIVLQMVKSDHHQFTSLLKQLSIQFLRKFSFKSLKSLEL
jgi:hypothetical protein